MSDDQFSIHLPQFEGPFDLLLFFIERDELSIHEIPIAKITDDFLDYIHQMNALNIELASEFIYVAATLMRIKAKMLLPRPDLDDEGNEVDLRNDLIWKLAEYKQFKLVSEQLRILENERFKQFKRGNLQADLEQIGITEPSDDIGGIGLHKLMMAYVRAMRRYHSRNDEVKHTVVQYPYSIEQQKESLAKLLAINKRLDYKALLQQSENRVHFVYNFLAMLEMLQQQLADIQLGLGFNNFWITAKA